MLAFVLTFVWALAAFAQETAVAPPTAAAPAVAGDADDRFEDSVVRLLVSKQAVDVSSPWQLGAATQQVHLGVVLGNKRILSTAFAVADAGFIEMQQFGEPAKHEMKVAFVDWEANLAVLEASNPDKAFAGSKPVVLGDDLKINDKVDIYRARDAYQMSRMAASIQEVGIYAAVTSSYSMVSYLLKVQQTGLGWSEPVFQGGRFVALTTGQDANYVYAMPASMIRHFLEDKLDGNYRGFPAIGVELDSLVSPDARRRLGAESVTRGIRISDVAVDSAFQGKLQVDDVLLEVAGVPVSEHGFITHPKWGKLHLKYLVNKSYAGDTLSLKILRKGQPMTVEAAIKRYDSNRSPIIAYRYGEKEPHLIFGGLVLQELTKSFLKQWGKDWRDLAPFDLMYTFENLNDSETDASKRLLVLNRVLADEFNRGYGEMRNVILDTVNDRPVRSMAELKAALNEAPLTRNGRRYARFRFLRGAGEIVLSYDGLEEAHKRIAATYEIATPESFFRFGP